MITCKFAGGLGNNIYQLAALYNMHKKYNVDYIIPSYVNRGNIKQYNQSDVLEFKQLFENDFNYINKFFFKFVFKGCETISLFSSNGFVIGVSFPFS